jgi:hypothetical protein
VNLKQIMTRLPRAQKASYLPIDARFPRLWMVLKTSSTVTGSPASACLLLPQYLGQVPQPALYGTHRVP